MLSFYGGTSVHQDISSCTIRCIKIPNCQKYGTLGILKNIGVVDKETNLPKVKAITGLKPFSD